MRRETETDLEDDEREKRAGVKKVRARARSERKCTRRQRGTLRERREGE